MSTRLRQNWAFLNLIATASIKQRKVILETINRQQLKTLLEVIYNVIHNRTVIPSEDYIKSLYKYRHLLRRLAKKSERHKKTLLIKRHRFIPILLKPLLSGINNHVK
jgi:gentisate 1,2-dioxygenase